MTIARIRLPAFEIDIDAVDGLTLKEIYIDGEQKIDHFNHEDGNIPVKVWRKS